MPAFSFHRPRFLRFQRSRSQSPMPSPVDPGDAASVSQSPDLAPSPDGAYLSSPCPSDSARFHSSQGLMFVPQHSVCSPTPSQMSVNSQRLTQSSGQFSAHSQYEKQGMFNDAHDLSVTGNFIDGNVANVTSMNIFATTSSQFMEKLLEKTIPGAACDSSARDPPPRCHPGTRLAIIERCLSFISNCDGGKKIRWIFGAAGVGKSAIMQIVAESILPVASRASVFFSVNGRCDGTKTIVTLAYQLAAKYELYYQFIEPEICHDPSLLESSMSVQFNKLIVEPFVYHPQLSSAGRVLIILDGLDECDNPYIQRGLLHLICNFCITYPSSPIVWLIASRPEPHITSYISRPKFMPACEKEEILVDSNEAREDVERFLRHKLAKIKETSDSLDPQSEWPEEKDFWKLANASGGLFVYAHTVINYIGDLNLGDPASQLSDVLNVIDNHSLPNMSREEHPMALLDVLYDQILSRVPAKVKINTRKLLLALASDWHWALYSTESNFIVLCNWLAMTPDEAYAAICHLRSVLRVPARNKAHKAKLESLHTSFIDYISDFTRSGFSDDVKREAQQFDVECTFRILKEAPDGIDFGGMDYQSFFGDLACAPGSGGNISLTWLADKVKWDDNRTRSIMYKMAIGEVVAGMRSGEPIFQSEFCIRLLIARFGSYGRLFPYDELSDLVFDESRRDELMKHGILKEVPLKVIDVSHMKKSVELRFRRPATSETNLSDPWNSSCEHEREGKWEEGKDKDWTTDFCMNLCDFCKERFERHLESWKAHSPDQVVPILFSSTGKCCVEFRFVDPEDGMSEWTYWFWCHFSLGERQMFGSAV